MKIIDCLGLSVGHCREPPLLRSGPGRLHAALLSAGARYRARHDRVRSGHHHDRDEQRHGQSHRPARTRRDHLGRQLSRRVSGQSSRLSGHRRSRTGGINTLSPSPYYSISILLLYQYYIQIINISY